MGKPCELMRPNTAQSDEETPPAVAKGFGKQDFAKGGRGRGGGGRKGAKQQQKRKNTHAWGCGTLTMEPLMLPMKTMLPFALRSMRWRATVVANR